MQDLETFARISHLEIRSFCGSSIYSDEPPAFDVLPFIAAMPPSFGELSAELSSRSNRPHTSLELIMDRSVFKRKHLRHTHTRVFSVSAVRQLNHGAENSMHRL